MFYGRSPAFLIISEELWVFTFYVWPTFRHWISKPIMSTTLAYVILRLVNVTVTDIESWSFCSIHLQDFRDVEGDYKTHTVTVVTMLSPASRRKTLQGTAIFMLFVNILSMFWICSRASQTSAFITGSLFYASTGFTVYYILSATSKLEYRIMYRWWTATLFFFIYHAYDLYL